MPLPFVMLASGLVLIFRMLKIWLTKLGSILVCGQMVAGRSVALGFEVEWWRSVVMRWRSMVMLAWIVVVHICPCLAPSKRSSVRVLGCDFGLASLLAWASRYG